MKKLIVPSVFVLLPAMAVALPPGANPTSMSDAFMQQLDSNKDGAVSKAEFLAPQEKQFADMDANEDGAVDRAEIEAVEKSMREQMQKMRKQSTGSR
ncbi:hypothetical protein [Thiolapillus sp.]